MKKTSDTKPKSRRQLETELQQQQARITSLEGEVRKWEVWLLRQAASTGISITTLLAEIERAGYDIGDLVDELGHTH